MARITSYRLYAVELPFRGKFEHAAHARVTSSSLFLGFELDDGTRGWGEALPRPYVTGESRDGACELLHRSVLPRLLGMAFADFDEVLDFLTECDGVAPRDWVGPGEPQSAAWCAVDLALLDTFGRRFSRAPFGSTAPALPAGFRYSGVLTSSRSWKRNAQLAAYRLLGYRALKLKVDDHSTAEEIGMIARRAGPKIALRADVNMGWDVEQALQKMPAFASKGIGSFEQPLPADDLKGSARLVRETGLDVMADESVNTRPSLKRLIELRAFTAISARISKCGGLVATLARCREAIEAGLWVQVGCQVGESSLLSAAHLRLCGEFGDMRHAEGCFGKLLLARDPALPLVQMKVGGRPPVAPAGPGLGVVVDSAVIEEYQVGYWHRSEGGA